MTLYLPLWGQDGSYPASLDRQLIGAALGPARVINGLQVVPRAAGANMTVDVGAGRVVMPGPSGPYLGYSDAVENEPVGAAPAAGTRRYDLVVARVIDPQAMGSGSTLEWVIEVVPGTPAASPVEPSLPAWSVPLARLDIRDTTLAVDPEDIADRRPVPGLLAAVRRSGDTHTGGTTTVPFDGVSRSQFTLTEARTVKLGFYGRLTRANNEGLSTVSLLINEARKLDHRVRIHSPGGPGQVTGATVRPVALAAGDHTLTMTLTANTGGQYINLNGGEWEAWVEDMAPATGWLV